MAKVDVIEGNLLSREDCLKATEDVSVIFHLAAGMEKSFPGAFMNSVVTTRNLLESIAKQPQFKRFVNVSSFAVYSPKNIRRGGMLDETCEIERNPLERHEAYCYGKVKQEEMVKYYAETHGTPYVIVRPGAVFGPGQKTISGRIGIDTFGIFLHLGGSNRIPFTYVDNCAELIMLSGIKAAVNGMVFNAVDDHLPTSREFLRRYKREVGKFRSIPIPAAVSYALCYLWERYSKWSQGQLPPAFNRSRWTAEWKGATYSNRSAKELLGWIPRIPIDEALTRYFQYQKQART
jgi:nucleoside-diphosphate-sugar epimerase